MNGFRPRADRQQYYLTAYGIALQEGFQGTKQQWLESLRGIPGPDGKSAYKYALEAGFQGDEEAFARKLADDGKSAYEYAVEAGYTGTEAQFAQKLAATPILILNEKKADNAGRYTLTAADLGALEKTGGTMTGALIVLKPTEDGNPVNLGYAKKNILMLAGGKMTGAIDFGGFPAENIKDPVKPQDAATRAYCIKTINDSVIFKKIILPADGWQEDGRQTISCQGITASNGVRVSPAPESYDAYYESAVRAVSQAPGEITFQWGKIKPEAELTVNLEIRAVLI